MRIGKARKMSFVSQNSSTSSTSMTVSSKPWFLTYNINDSDVFVWRDGVCMKLRIAISDKIFFFFFFNQAAVADTLSRKKKIVRKTPHSVATCIVGPHKCKQAPIV